MWRSGLRGNFLRVSPAELQLSKRWKEVRPTMISSTGFFRERKKISKTRLLGARLGFFVSVVDLDSLEYNSLPLGGQSPLAKLLGKVNHDLVPPLRATGAPDAGRSGARLPRPRVQEISQRSWAVHPAETWSWHLSGITQSLGFVLENCRHTLPDRTRQNRIARQSQLGHRRLRSTVPDRAARIGTSPFESDLRHRFFPTRRPCRSGAVGPGKIPTTSLPRSPRPP